MTKLFKMCPQRKKALLLKIVVVLFLFLMPCQFVKAQGPIEEFCPGCGPFPWQWPTCIVCLLDYIRSLPVRLVFFFFALALGLLALVTGVVFSMVVSWLNWVTTVAVSIPITSGGVVDVGWTFTRDFVNMFFILILAFIGLATILKLREYEIQKTLPKLIFVVLLINFTPVIVGLVVDVANIFTNFFLTRAAVLSSLPELLDLAFDYMADAFFTIFTIDGEFFEHFLTDYNGDPAILGVFISIIVYGFVLVIFYGLAALVYLIVTLLLFVRILFLWILMIVAPIAFFSQALPSSKTIRALFPSIFHWDEWWEKLIQWSIIGIPLGFFLYLSNWIMVNQGEINELLRIGELGVEDTVAGSITVPLASGISLITGIFAPLAALALLGFGTMVSIQAAPAGARTVIDWGKKGGKKMGGFAVGTIRGVPAISKGEEEIRKRMEAMPVVGRVVGGPGAYEREKQREIAAVSKEFEKLPPDEIRRVMAVRPITYKEKLRRVRLFDVLAEKRELSDKEKQYIPMAQKQGGDIDKMLGRRPDWASEVGKTIEDVVTETEPEDFRKNVQREAVSLEVSPGIPKSAADALKSGEVVYRIMMDQAKFEEIQNKARASIKREIKKTFTNSTYLVPATSWPLMVERWNELANNPKWRV